MTEFGRFWRLEFSAGGGPLTQALSQRLGAVLAYLGQSFGLTPNLLTTLGLGCYMVAALLLALLPAGTISMLACLVLYQVAYSLDCSDGQLARANSQAGEFGAWWDVSADAVSSLALAFALIHLLGSQDGGIGLLALITVFPLAAGRVLTLYSSKAAAVSSRGTGGGSRGAQFHKPVKWFLWMVIDTPTLLLVICLLRDAPTLLSVYIASMGLIYCLNAAYLGWTKLRTA